MSELHAPKIDLKTVHLDAPDGHISLRVAEAKNPKAGKPSVVVLMHGVEGHCGLPYMIDTAHSLVEAGHNVIMFNHYNVPNEKNLRLLNFTKPETTDEVLAYARSRFIDCELTLIGFSLGGNHALTYAGKSAKNRLEGKSLPND